MVGIVKELGNRELDTIWYNDPTFGMDILSDDKDALDIADLCKLHLTVGIYIQYDLSDSMFYDGPLEEEELNRENIIDLGEEEELLVKLYEEAVREGGGQMVRDNTRICRVVVCKKVRDNMMIFRVVVFKKMEDNMRIYRVMVFKKVRENMMVFKMVRDKMARCVMGWTLIRVMHVL